VVLDASINASFDATKAEWEGLYRPAFDIAGWNPWEDVPAERWWDKFEELDLDTFANMIEQSRLGKWLSHLVMIKWEFRLPYEDPRKPMALFQLLTGETDLTLYPGKFSKMEILVLTSSCLRVTFQVSPLCII